MNPILQNKRFFTAFFFALIFSVGVYGQTEKISVQTSQMLKSLSELNRSDTQNAEHEALIQAIFSNKKYQKQAGPLIEEFLLSGKNLTGKRYLLAQMGKAGTPAAVKYLAEMLAFDNSAELALMTLQEIPGARVNKLLKKSFSKASEKIKPGILNALGKRGDESAIKLISKHIHDKNPDMSGAAVSALGMIGTPGATTVLTRAVQSGDSKDQFLVMEALLDVAEQLISKNQSDRAFEIYNTLLSADPPKMIAVAALKGKMKTTAGNPADIIKKELTTSSDELKPEVIDLVKNLPGSWKSGHELLQLPGLQDIDKSRLMVILAERNDKSIHDEVVQFIHHEEPVYRESAIYALSRIAELKDIPLLAELAAARTGKEQSIAREGLYRLPGRDVDSFILEQAVNSKDEAQQAEYIKAISERNIPSAAPALIRAAKSDSREVRIESYRTLAKVAGKENMDELIELLLDVDNSRERQELERALYLVSTKDGQENASTKEIIAFLGKTREKENKSSLISVLGSIKNPDDLKVLESYLNSEDVDLKLSAIRALSEWPNAEPAEKMKKIMEETDDLRVKILALRGFTQILVNDNTYPDGKKVDELLFGLSNAPNENEKKLIISALGKVSSPEALEALTNQMKDPGNLRPELEAAIVNMVPGLMNNNKKNTIATLRRLAKYTDNAEILKWLNN